VSLSFYLIFVSQALKRYNFESAFGGLGGCPFTKLPAGNVSTEDLVHSLQRMGLRKDIKLDVLLDVAQQVSVFFNRELPGFILKSGSIVDFQGVTPTQ